MSPRQDETVAKALAGIRALRAAFEKQLGTSRRANEGDETSDLSEPPEASTRPRRALDAGAAKKSAEPTRTIRKGRRAKPTRETKVTIEPPPPPPPDVVAPVKAAPRARRRANPAREPYTITEPTAGASWPHIALKTRTYLAVQEVRKGTSNGINAIRRMLGKGEDGLADLRVELQHVLPKAELLEQPTATEQALKKDIERMVMAHPFGRYFVERHDGIGPLGLAEMWAVFGDFDRFLKPSSLFHFAARFPHEGRVPRVARGVKITAGSPTSYSPRAKTIMYRLADAACKGKQGTHYRDLYDAERVDVLNRPRLGPSGCPFNKVHERFEREENEAGERRRVSDEKQVQQCVNPCPGGKGHEDCAEGAVHSDHVNKHCKLIVAREILLDLWHDWQRFNGREVATPPRRSFTKYGLTQGEQAA